MSVVNRMLQDIDRRRMAAGIDARPQTDIRSVAPSARSSARTPRAGGTRRGSMIALAMILVAVAIAAVVTTALLAWRGWATTSTSTSVVASAPPPSITAVVDATSAAVPAPANAAPPATASSAATAEPGASASTVAVVETTPPNLLKATPPIADALKLSIRLSTLIAPTAASSTPLKNAPNTPTTSVVPQASSIARAQTSVPTRQVATDETVRIARALWNDGARAAALETLREALASAETARNNRATATLARELARLQVADNRVLPALDLLKRLENLLLDDADAWALRGNAEQRLTLHPEAAESYLTALRLRPTEGKWMLGAAISLAAAGKPDEARVWVERARERGAVTPTIAAYLQQLGIGSR